MSHGHHPLSWVGGRHIYQKGARPFEQSLFRLNVIGPHLVAQIRDEASGKRAPIALTQQWCSHNGQSVRFSNDLSRLNGSMKVAGNYCIQRL